MNRKHPIHRHHAACPRGAVFPRRERGTSPHGDKLRGGDLLAVTPFWLRTSLDGDKPCRGVTNFQNYLVPHPNLGVLSPNVRFFVDHNVVGLFEQGDSQSGIGDFVALRAWLPAHLAAPPKRPGEVQHVYVDRIFLIRN